MQNATAPGFQPRHPHAAGAECQAIEHRMSRFPPDKSAEKAI
jgi:hypothetical protein